MCADRVETYLLFRSLALLGFLSCRGRRLDDPLLSRGEHCSPAKNHKITFPLSYFCMTKSTKSHQRERSPLFENSFRVHELVARAMRGKCARHGSRAKVGGFAILHSFSHTTRANISHEKTEQIRARIACTPAKSAGIDRFAKQMRSASPRQGKRAWVRSVR